MFAANVQQYEYWSTVRATAVLTEQISIVVLFFVSIELISGDIFVAVQQGLAAEVVVVISRSAYHSNLRWYLRCADCVRIRESGCGLSCQYRGRQRSSSRSAIVMAALLGSAVLYAGIASGRHHCRQEQRSRPRRPLCRVAHLANADGELY